MAKLVKSAGFYPYDGSNIIKKPTGVFIPPPAVSTLTNNLVSYYPFDGNTNDVHGINDGTNNGVSETTGKINSGYHFDGNDSRVTIGSGTSISIASDMTISMWINLSTSLSDSYLMSDWSGANRNYLFRVYNNQINCVTGDGLDAQITTFGLVHSTVLSTNIWYHVCYVRDGNILKAIVNTVAEEYDITGYTGGSTINNINIGATTAGTSGEFIGDIDEVGAWERALNSTEINQLYNNGNGLGYSNF